MPRGEVHYAPPTEDGGGVPHDDILEIDPDDIIEMEEKRKGPPPIPENAKKGGLLAGEGEAFSPFAEENSPTNDRNFPEGLLSIDSKSEILSMRDNGRVLGEEEQNRVIRNEKEELSRKQEVAQARRDLDRVAEQTSKNNIALEAYRKNSTRAQSGEAEQRQFLQKYGSYQDATHLQQRLSKKEVAKSKRENTFFGRISNKFRDAFSGPPSQSSENLGKELVRFHEIERQKKSAKENLKELTKDLSWLKEQITSRKFTLPEIMDLVEANSDNKKLAIMIAEVKPMAIQNFSAEVLHDPEVIMKAVETMPRAIGFAKDYFATLSPDKAFEVLQPILQKNPGIFSVLPPELHSSEAFGRLVINEITTWPEEKANNALGRISQFLDRVVEPKVRNSKKDLRVKLGLPEPEPRVGVVDEEQKRNRSTPVGKSAAAADRGTLVLDGLVKSHDKKTNIDISQVDNTPLPIPDDTYIDTEPVYDDEDDDNIIPNAPDTNPGYTSAPDTPIDVPVRELEPARRFGRESIRRPVVFEPPEPTKTPELDQNLAIDTEKVLDVELEKLPNQREALVAMFSLYKSNPDLVKTFLAESIANDEAKLPDFVSILDGAQDLEAIEPAQAHMLQGVLDNFDELEESDKQIVLDIAGLLKDGKSKEADDLIFGRSQNLSLGSQKTPRILGSGQAEEPTTLESILKRAKILEQFGFGSRAEEVEKIKERGQNILEKKRERKANILFSPSAANQQRTEAKTGQQEEARVEKARNLHLSSRDFITTFSNYIRLGVSNGERDQYIEALKDGISESTPPKIANYVKMIGSPKLRHEAALELESFAGLKEQGDVRKAIDAIKSSDKSSFETILKKYQKNGSNAIVRVMLEKMNPYDPFSGRKRPGVSVVDVVGEHPGMRNRPG